jgi:hypothetical protein
METIFSYKPTASELEEITGYGNMTEQEYIEHLSQRVETNDSSEEYERTVDLEHFFYVRENFEKMNEYKLLLSTKFEAIGNRLFNE